MHVQIKAFSILHLQGLIPILVDINDNTSQSTLNLIDVLENAIFVNAFGYVVELTVTGLCIIGASLSEPHIYVKGSNGKNGRRGASN